MISGEWVWFDCLKFFAIVASTNPQKGCATNNNNNHYYSYCYNNVVHVGDDAFDMLLTAKQRPAAAPPASSQDTQWQLKDIWLPWLATRQQGNPHVACWRCPEPELNSLHCPLPVLKKATASSSCAAAINYSNATAQTLRVGSIDY